MKPYSRDLRLKILFYSFNHSISKAAKAFDISPNTVFLLRKLYIETGDVEPLKSTRKYDRIISQEGEDFILARILVEPDLTISDLCSDYEKEFKVLVSSGTMCNALKRLNITRKKKSFTDPKKYTDEAQEKREYYQDHVSEVPREQLRFLDEFGCVLNMTTSYGRSPKDSPAYEEKPTHSSTKLNTIAVMSENGFENKFSFESSLTTKIFLYFLEYIILPNYKGETIVMDGHPVHHSKKTIKFLEDNNIKYLILPPYSPELNPIEEAFSKVKGFIKKNKPRTLETLKYVLDKALNNVTASDAHGYFEHAAQFSWV